MPDEHRQAADRSSSTPGNASRKPRIAILGAGFAGMGMAIQLRQAGIDSFTIYEKADEVGGTWRENTYPGVACDVPSHLYSFSFEPNPNWSQRYSPGEEIWEYTKHCARKYDLYRSIVFGKTVTAIRHDGRQWHVAFKDGSSVFADFVISGLGGLHEPNIPDFKGAADFNGEIFHTAQWRHDVDLTGKRVAIIGSAASAVQVVPEIAGKVAKLEVYQRTPNWVMPRRSYSYPKWLRSVFRRILILARAYRGFYFSIMEWRFGAFKSGENYIKRFVDKQFQKQMDAQVTDDKLRANLTPNYPVGCKRILISDDYLPAMQRENVELVTDAIETITAQGIRTHDGTERKADVIIMATGFKVFDILASIDVIGPSGTSLRDIWRGGIAAHRTIAVPGFPNFFLVVGPNSGLGHNSVILMIEAQVKYIISLINSACADGVKLIEPKDEAAKEYDRQTQSALRGRVWAANCGAWYVDESGRNFTLYPHAVRDFLREMKEPDMAEFELRSAPVQTLAAE